jgi:predicted nucleotidyltransferase
LARPHSHLPVREPEEERPDSDWDIAFLTDHDTKIDPVERWKVQEKLAALLGEDVDLVDLQAASTVMRFEVITTSKRIYCTDEYYCGVFEMLTFSYHQWLNENRKFILEDIRKRGSVYG